MGTKLKDICNVKSRDKVYLTCSCGSSSMLRCDYARSQIRKYGEYKCHKCAIKSARSDGRGGRSKEKSSEISMKLWKNKEFANNVTIGCKRSWTEDKKRQASCKTKECWDIGVYDSLSETIKAKFANDLEYRERVSNGLKLKYQNDPKYKEAISKFNSEKWNDPEYRKKMAAVYKSTEYRTMMAEIRSSQAGKISSIQRMLYQLLDDVDATYYPESIHTQIGYYVFDCLVKTPDGKRDVLIECQGDYWHSLVNNVRNDKSKFTYIDRYFPEYEIMYVWEHEFYTKDRVLDRLKSKLGVDIESIDFDFGDVNVRRVSSKDIKCFLDAYHYIGKDRGGICLGAYLNDDLIGCCVFSPPVRQNLNNKFGDFVELSRFCIHPSYHKKNFASWFISRCLKYTTKNIVAYADTTVGHLGIIYKASNFEFCHEVPANYWYVDIDGYVMHKRTLYGKAKKMCMTETEFANKKGYFKKWGGKKLCYVYDQR